MWLKCPKPKKLMKKLIKRHALHERTEEIVIKETSWQKPARYVEDKYVLSTVPWYWPRLTRRCADSLMKFCPNGTFLVRRSETIGFMFAITRKESGRVVHSRIHCREGLFSLGYSDQVHPREPTLQLLIGKLLDLTETGNYILMMHTNDGTEDRPFKLHKSLKRDVTLQEHCRREIMRSIHNNDDVLKFDIPQVMKSFLLELNDAE